MADSFFFPSVSTGGVGVPIARNKVTDSEERRVWFFLLNDGLFLHCLGTKEGDLAWRVKRLTLIRCWTLVWNGIL